MTLPTKVTLELKYGADGMLDTGSLINALEGQLDGQLVILDWYDENFASIDYPHLDSEQRRALISSVSVGDYDEGIDKSFRKAITDDAAERAEVPPYANEAEELAP